MIRPVAINGSGATKVRRLSPTVKEVVTPGPIYMVLGIKNRKCDIRVH
jgi:hypothetical protein